MGTLAKVNIKTYAKAAGAGLEKIHVKLPNMDQIQKVGIMSREDVIWISGSFLDIVPRYS